VLAAAAQDGKNIVMEADLLLGKNGFMLAGNDEAQNKSRKKQ
jgi:hypothetical protein